jgi:hypothetical protein
MARVPIDPKITATAVVIRKRRSLFSHRFRYHSLQLVRDYGVRLCAYSPRRRVASDIIAPHTIPNHVPSGKDVLISALAPLGIDDVEH